MSSAPDHGVVDGAPSTPPPLLKTDPAPRLSAAEEARTLVNASRVGALATLTLDGDPWASLVAYGLLDDGAPVLCLSRLAEHGRNVESDARASLMVTQTVLPADPLAVARVTLAGRCVRPADGAEADQARSAHLAGVPSARYYLDFSDFQLWILRPERARWVGGYGRMDSAAGADYAAAQPDPVFGQAAAAISHLNADHADALVDIVRALGGYSDAAAVTCTAIDRYGMDFSVSTPRGQAPARVAFPAPLEDAGELRRASVELTERARRQPAV